jgi:hypothetical protein
VAEGFPPGLALDDAAGAVFAGTELREIVSSTPDARGYRVGLEGESPLEARAL